MKRLIVALLLLASTGMVAQERPMAVTTLNTTDTSASSVCVGCAVGTTTASGGIKANALSIITSASGAQNAVIQTTTSGTTTQAKVTLSSGTTNTILSATSQGWTASGPYKQSSTFLDGDGVGGISISASNAAGVIGLYTNQLLRWGVNAAGDFTYGTSSHISDSVGTVSSIANSCTGAGCAATANGTDYAFVVTASGVSNVVTSAITFGHTWSTTPVCTAGTSDSGNAPIVISSVTTTGFTLSTQLTGTKIYILCRSY